MSEPQSPKRTPAARKARQIAKYLRAERPDYAYLKQVFRHLREELGVEVQRAPKKLPHVPTEHEIRSFYEAVWNGRRSQDVVMIKTLLYTGVRVSELVRIRLGDVDLDGCRIRIEQGKGKKDRYVRSPQRSRKRSHFTSTRTGRPAPATSSSPPGRSPTQTAACARSSPGTPPRPGSRARSAPTGSATSCSRG